MTHPIRVVLAGCGGISRAWLEAIRDISDIRMVGFVDIDESAARSRAEQFGWTEAAIGADLSAVLPTTRPDAVFDCTIPEAHVQVTLAALRHGCHVLGEKPLADSMAHARRDGRGGAGSGQNLCRHPEPPLRSEHPPAAQLPRVGRHRRADHGQLRFLHRRALRRLPRPDGARAAARHGDPHLRRGAADLRRGRDCGLLPRVEPGRLLVRSRRVGRGDLRDDRGHRLSPIAAVGAPRGCTRAGSAIGGSSARRAA